MSDPRAGAIGPAPTDQYYTINLRHASLREIYRYLPSHRARLTAVLKKLIGIDNYTGACVADAHAMRFWGTKWRPAEVPSSVQDGLDECGRRGLAVHGFHSAAGFDGVVSYGAVLTPPDRRFWAQLVWAWSHQLGQSAAPTWLACTSVMSGGLMTTTNIPPSLDPPPDFDVEYHEHATVGETIQRHASRLQAATMDCQVIVDPAEAIRNAITRKLDYHRSRRMLVQFDAVALQQMDGSPCLADHGMVESGRARPE